MAFIVSKLARAALASRPVGDIAGGISPCLSRLYLAASTSRRMFAAAGNPYVEKAFSKFGSESRLPKFSKEFSYLDLNFISEIPALCL